MNEYLTGAKLYGDDFTLDKIRQWYDEETEGYADLGSKEKTQYSYSYHNLNIIHGFSKIKSGALDKALGLGSAWGYEFEPVLDKIKEITIVEPSDNLRNDKIGNIVPTYVKPEVDGSLKFDDNTFDLITCFATLHHIPNVSHVLSEIIRVAKPGGYILIREPIVSMGDWSHPRPGLTKNERGIPKQIFEKAFANEPIEIISKEHYFTVTSYIGKIIGRRLSKPIHTYKVYILFDKLLSSLLKGNIHYHATNPLGKIAPSSVFYVLKKVGWRESMTKA